MGIIVPKVTEKNEHMQIRNLSNFQTDTVDRRFFCSLEKDKVTD